AEVSRQLARQVVLCVERVGVNIRRRNLRRRAVNLHLLISGRVRRYTPRVEVQDERGVGRVAERRVVRAERVEYLVVGERRAELVARAAADSVARLEGRVGADVREVNERDAVVRDAEAAAYDHPVLVEQAAEGVAEVRRVGEADARGEVVAVGREEAFKPADDARARQLLPARGAEDE